MGEGEILGKSDDPAVWQLRRVWVVVIGAEWAAAVVVSAVAEQSEWPQVEGTRVLGGITGGCVTRWRVLGKIESCIDQY